MDAEILNLFLLPLLGGYIFYTKFHWTALAASWAEEQRLIYSSSAIGVFLLLAGRGLDWLIERLAAHPQAHESALLVAVGLASLATFPAGILTTLAGKTRALKAIPNALPNAARICGCLLPAVGIALYSSYFQPQLWHIAVAVAGMLLLFLIIVYAARWIARASDEIYLRAAI